MVHRIQSLLRFWRVGLVGLVLLLLLAGGIFATSSHPAIFPIRNTLIYQLTGGASPADAAQTGQAAFQGCVQTAAAKPAAAATVLVSEQNGTTHTTTTAADGCYRLAGLPGGRYVPVVGTPGGVSRAVRRAGLPLSLASDEQQTLNVTLPPVSLPHLEPARNLRLGEPLTRTWPLPHPGSAIEQTLTFVSGGRENQQAFYYTPLTATATAELPVLLVVYPGPAAAWEGVSIPLAAAGYAVVATGPAYALDLEADVAELRRIVGLLRAGHFPAANGRQVVLMGGSYSSLHVLRLLSLDVAFAGVVLLGPPTDLFELRRKFAAGDFSPPFGLDRALIALGYPNTEPERYWRYSARYHVQRDWPPILLMHSRSDEVVPFPQSALLAEELEAAGVPHRAEFFAGMSHYLRANEPSEDLDMLYSILLDFLDEALAGEGRQPIAGD